MCVRRTLATCFLKEEQVKDNSGILVSLSGGMDSAVVLSEAIATGRQVQAVSFSYGSKHNKFENIKANELANHYGVKFNLLDFSSITAGFKSNLMQSGGPIPEGHYDDVSMAQTVVPGRNLIFISILTGLAWSRELGEVWIGIHRGDALTYPDCRPQFFTAMRDAVFTGSDGRIRLVAPFLDADKGGIVKRGLYLATPFQLTRTCYCDGIIACGRCGSCQERLEAFAKNGQDDPIEYSSRELLPKSC